MLKKIFTSYKTPAQKKQNRKELILGLVTGILMAASFPPIPLPYLAFVALVPYLIVLDKRSTLAEVNRFTYFTIFFFNLGTLYWVGSWTADADPFLMIAGSVLMFFNPIVFLIPSSLYFITRKYISRKAALYLLPWFWLFFEYIYSVSDFRFPWLSLSNSLPYFTSYIQIADIIGSYGLTILIIYANIFAYFSWQSVISDAKFKSIFPFTLILIIIIPVIYGTFKLGVIKDPTQVITVGLIQPNLNPNKKWEVGNLDEQIDLYQNLSESAIQQGAEILIWPETALPVYLLTDAYRKQTERIQDFVERTNVPILTGMPHANFYSDIANAPFDSKPLKNSKRVYTSYNSILFFSPNKDVKQYGKIKLVPFGEKVPLVDVFPVLGKWIKWNVGISSWNTGSDTTVFKWQKDNDNEVKIGGVICIESIYPDFVSAFVERGSDFIAVVTNDSWYGNSSGPYQHKEMSVLRAVENRRTVVRSANGGISCIISPLGKTIMKTEMFTKAVLVGKVELNSDLTFFSSAPLLFPIISIFVVFIVAIISFTNKIKKRK